MEHRWGARTRVAIHLEALRGSEHFDRCQTSNIGQGGLFLSCDESKFDEGDLLTLKIGSGYSARPSRLEYKALVVHVSEKGAGLMWADKHSDLLADFYRANETIAGTIYS